jgi:hypothetical protein
MYVFLILSSAYVVYVAINSITKDKKTKKTTIAKLIISSIVLILCIVDLLYFWTGGISKLTDIKIILDLSRNSRAYTFAVITDHDEKFYFASGMRKVNFIPEGENY